MRLGTSVASVGLACTEVHVQEPIVVEIAEIATHRHEHHIQTGIPGLVLEALAFHVMKEPVRQSAVRLADQTLDRIFDGVKS